MSELNVTGSDIKYSGKLRRDFVNPLIVKTEIDIAKFHQGV